MTDQELKDLVAGLAVSQAETDRQLQELRDSQAETDRLFRESWAESDRRQHELRDLLREEHAETARELRKLSRQATETRREVGGLANKFGTFTEGLACPSLVRIFRDRFGLNIVGPRARAFNNGETIELDG